MTSKTNFIFKHSSLLLAIIAVLFSVISFFWSYENNYVVSYNDSMSHLNVARLVIDNIEQGPTQLGDVWLPLNHILSLALVWNDWAWHSGFAGSIFSMVAYVFSVVFLYKTIKIITDNEIASWIGALAFALNINILYLQTTPLTESIFVSLFILSVYLFAKWTITNDSKYLVFLGITGFFEIFIRYDGWFVYAILGIIIIGRPFLVLNKKEWSFNETFGRLMVFAFPILFGAMLWFVWNFLIFNDPLYFALGQHSAKSQQDIIASSSGLIVKGNIYESVLVYFYAIISNVGIYLLITACLGALILFFDRKIKGMKVDKALILIVLVSPVIFNVLALYLGFSIINVPQLYLEYSGEFSQQLFNVRYGILALPFVAVAVGVFSNFKKIFMIIALFLVLCQGLVMSYEEGIITLTDGTVGTSSFNNQDVAQELKNLVKVDDKVIISMSFFNPVTFKSGLDLEQFIHEGVSRQWNDSLIVPENYAKWIVMSSKDEGEPVYNSLINRYDSAFLHFYKLKFEGKYANIYELEDKDEDKIFVKRAGINLINGTDRFYVKGINSYDLAYRSSEEITASFENFNKAGINTVRFWLFGDGMKDGFQPRAGIMNEDRFLKSDLIISLARKHNIKLIPVLVNNWNDYGGKKQYLAWTGKARSNGDLFYTDKVVSDLFKNYIDHVISRNNSITGTSYYEEPSIMAWDIINEPRVSKVENEGNILTWTSDISSYLKSKDNNHLIMVGTEKNTVEGICSLEDVSICSVHLYFSDEGKAIYANFQEIEKNIIDQKSIANDLDKPIIVGEIGSSKKERVFDNNPLDLLRDSIDLFIENKYNGYLIWNWGTSPDDSFGFSDSGYGKAGDYNSDDLRNLVKE